MSLDRTRLQKVRDLANGGLQAQCPACAEAGQDRKGEHLRISPQGKFGCCVFPGDRNHRSRIFALAGDHGPKLIRVKVAMAKTAEVVQLDLLGRLGRVMWSPECRVENGGAETDEIGTLGTTTYSLCVGENKTFVHKLIDNREPVPSVPVEVAVATVRLPYLTPAGDLVIPFSSPKRYHWWAGGQSI